MGKPSSFLIISVLLVAPSASLAGPVPAAEPAAQPHHQAVVLPWTQVGTAATPGGFIYCAGCSPISPHQVVLPPNAPINKALPVISASGVLPPNHIPTDRQLNGLGLSEEPGKGQKIWDDGSIPVQQMALHDDGRYSFSYNTADASRQEERNLDGSVSGSYSYTDPTGKLIQVDYTAGPQGYNAYGENIPPQPVFQLPQPVRDTPEVQEARERFLQAYASELARHQQESDTAHISTNVVPVVSSDGPSSIAEDAEATTLTPVESNDEADVASLDGQNEDEAIHGDDALVVSGKSEHGQDDENQEQSHGSEIVDDDSDSVVISADEPVNNIQTPAVSLPSPAYQITIPIGGGQNAGLNLQQGPQDGQKSGEAQQIPQPIMQDGQNQLKSNLQPYFYYVSVGGSPHYVTAPSIPGYNSPYPTSLKATLLNSLPLAAVHDAQVPNRGNNDNMNMNMNNDPGNNQGVNRPVFLDLGNGNSVQENQQSPQNQNNDQMQMQWQLPQQFPNNQQQMQMQQWQIPQQNLNNQQQMQQWQIPQQQLNNQQQWQMPQLNNQQQMQMQQWQMPQQQNPSLINNNNNQHQNQNQLSFNNPLIGQLVPIQLAPLGSHNNGGLSFGYIPGLILSNGGVVAPTQQQNDGSQSSNVQTPSLSFNFPQQQQQQQQDQQQAPTSAPALNDDPVIVLASKK